MKAPHRRFTEYANQIAVAKDNIENLFDDAIEEDNHDEFVSLVDTLYTSKLPPYMISDILTQAMDTAYRGTKITPPGQHSATFVGYLTRYGIPVPTYNFTATRKQ